MILFLASCSSDTADKSAQEDRPVSTTTLVPVESTTLDAVSEATAELPPASVPLIDEDRREQVPYELPSDPQARAEALVLGDNDISGTSFVPSSDDDELCLSVGSFVNEYSPVASVLVASSTEHDVVSGAYVFETSGDAQAALAYVVTSGEQCTGELIDATPGAEVVGYYGFFDPAPIADSVATIAYDAEFTEADNTSFVSVEVAVVDTTMLMVGSTDSSVVRAGLELVALRANGMTREPGLELSGERESGPGFADAQYWSWPERGPAEIRSVTVPVVQDWASKIADPDLDRFASIACALAWDVRDESERERWLAGLSSSEVALPLGSEEQAAAVAMRVYCPGLLDESGLSE